MQLKLWLQDRVPPSVFAAFRGASHLRPSHRRWVSQQAELATHRRALDDQVIRLVGSSAVQRGPLAGTKMNRESSWGLDFSARLLGSYERELHPFIEELVNDSTPMVIDVGCADGYYIAGLGRRAPSARILGYDTDPAALRVTQNLAELNSVAGRLELKTLCRSHDLLDLPAGTVVLMDCEGAEATLMTRDVVVGNPSVSFIIECHESVVQGVTEQVRDLFEDRDTVVVEQQARTPADAPSCPPDLALEVMDELRALGDRWLVARGAPTHG